MTADEVKVLEKIFDSKLDPYIFDNVTEILHKAATQTKVNALGRKVTALEQQN